jgi:hypothetical protein
MMEVIVAKRRRSWEWRVHSQEGALIMHGRERTRPAARYQGYRCLFMLLAIGPRPHEPRTSKLRNEQLTGRKGVSDLVQLQRPARPFTLD